MQSGKALLVGLGFVVLALSGCSSPSGGGGSTGFTVTHESGSTYTFKASGTADNYTWDLGDRLNTQVPGKKVTHTYDFTNGKVNVVLLTKKGTAPATESRKQVVIGSGVNGEATFILEGSQNWTVLGEPLKLSASASTDPDGDALRYAWSCVRTGDAIRTTPHTHGFGNVPYATPPAGTVTARLANGTLPAADKTYDGDFCEALGSGSRPTLAATIEGTFTKTGVYDIYLLASDPVHPSTSGKFHFVVTDPEDRPNATTAWTFTGNFQGGAGGSVQDACIAADQCGENTYDYVEHQLQLPLNGVSGSITVVKVGDTTPARLTWQLIKGSTTPIEDGKDGDTKALDATDLGQGGYTIKITLDGGADVDYTAVLTVELDMDPFKVY